MLKFELAEESRAQLLLLGKNYKILPKRKLSIDSFLASSAGIVIFRGVSINFRNSSKYFNEWRGEEEGSETQHLLPTSFFCEGMRATKVCHNLQNQIYKFTNLQIYFILNFTNVYQI